MKYLSECPSPWDSTFSPSLLPLLLPPLVSSVPLQLEVVAMTPTLLNITWLSPSEPNGQPSYSVHYSTFPLMETSSHGNLGESPEAILTNNTEASLMDLIPFTNYNITVFAVTSCGRSEGATMSATTLTSLPGPPLSVTVVAALPYSLRLMWEEPAFPNGIIVNYNVSTSPSPHLQLRDLIN